MRVATIMKVAVTKVMPTITGRSASFTELTAREPSPGRLKMLSVMIAPPSRPARSSPAAVTIGVKPARKACFRMTMRSGRPLARAVRM